MKFLNVLLFSFLLIFASCSSKKKNEAQEGEDVYATEIDQDLDEVDDGDAEVIVENDEDMSTEEVADSDSNTDEILEETVASNDAPAIEMSGDVKSYTVEANDTLMLIAFKLYGDYGKWREIARLNNIGGEAVSKGMTLKYYAPVDEFVWNPKGEPYLIKNGDTLSLISKSVYGIYKRWPEIYENNRPMIKKPDLIFAGFTLYYLPDGDSVAVNL